MGRIRALPEALRSQIAAGEVVERPASVIKELVENSLDAGARNVRVEVESGGLERLVVTDDGEGMDHTDAQACLGRHATSKLSTLDDLGALNTYGFRGEALPSVASVSKLTLSTREHQAVEGTRLITEGGKVLTVEPCGCAAGTRLEVRELFFNVPARRKFQKSPRSETSHIEEWLTRLALAVPEADFRLDVEGKEVLRAPAARDGTAEKERAEVLLGKSARGALFAVEGQVGELTIRGFLANPALSRGDAKNLFLYVNGRFVKDRTLTHAVMDSYRTLLEVGRFPTAIINVHMPPAQVDVNVHPQKLEVRFLDASALHRAVTSVLAPMLATTPWLRTTARQYVLAPAPETPSVASDVGEFHRKRTQEALERYAAAAAEKQRSGAPLERTFVAEPASHGVDKVSTKPPEPSLTPARVSSLGVLPGMGGAGRFSRLTALGQVGRTYLVCEGPEGMVLVDQHAAHERVNFERLRKGLEKGDVLAQQLLIPLRIQLSAAEEEALGKHLQSLARAGFEVDTLGYPDWLLRSVPMMLHGRQPERVCRELLAELAETGASSPLQDAFDKVLSRVACHGSVRAGDPMSMQEIQALLESMDGVDLSAHCPHGRPVVRSIPLQTMATWFDRL